jgi:hypothetical protein
MGYRPRPVRPARCSRFHDLERYGAVLADFDPTRPATHRRRLFGLWTTRRERLDVLNSAHTSAGARYRRTRRVAMCPRGSNEPMTASRAQR